MNVALFTIVKTRRQPECPSTDKCTVKMWYRYMVEYYSAIKNEIMPFAATWMKLEIVILNEISQTEKEKYHITFPICGIYKEMRQLNLQNKKRLRVRE